ncbi:ABC transporter permease subunit [Aerococcus sp. L_32]|uniref:ABC transporter permease subunit n=1 Tax=Aerococcus sp. L_32 TaxID=3422316 RepID=UPI003D6ABF6A
MTKIILSDIRWDYIFNPQLTLESIPFVLEGLSYTIAISLLSFILSLIGGTILALMRISRSRLLRILARFYVSFFRGVPVLVTLFFLYFGLPLANLMLTAVLLQSSP